MSKLSIIRQALETNPEVGIANIENNVSLPGGFGAGYCHFVDYNVYPRKGLYSLDELQGFLSGLVPNLVPEIKRHFEIIDKPHRDPPAMEFGSLCFEEEIGRARIETRKVLTITDEELMEYNGFESVHDGKTVTGKRAIYIHPFPDEAYARGVPPEGQALGHLNYTRGLLDQDTDRVILLGKR